MSTLSEEERRHEQTIGERDAAEEALSQAFYLIVGHSPEWSNLFGHKEALGEIDDAQRLLRETIANQSAEIARLRVALEDLIDAVEPPPEPNCSCHISPPCHDCVDHSELREFLATARAALTKEGK